MPASIQPPATLSPLKGKGWSSVGITSAHVKHMKKQVDIKGGDKLSDILTLFGKVVDKSKRTITLSFDIYSDMKMVKGSVQANAADKAVALSKLTAAEKLAILKYDSLVKEATAARDTGALVERWTISGTATQV